MRVQYSDLEAGNSPGNGWHLHGWIVLHTTSRVIACSLIYSSDLPCGKGTRLECCEVIIATGDFDMTILSLGRLYSFCLVGSLLPMLHSCNMGNVWVAEPHAPWPGHTFHL
jgi:hypothetical protein